MENGAVRADGPSKTCHCFITPLHVRHCLILFAESAKMDAAAIDSRRVVPLRWRRMGFRKREFEPTPVVRRRQSPLLQVDKVHMPIWRPAVLHGVSLASAIGRDTPVLMGATARGREYTAQDDRGCWHAAGCDYAARNRAWT